MYEGLCVSAYVSVCVLLGGSKSTYFALDWWYLKEGIAGFAGGVHWVQGGG